MDMDTTNQNANPTPNEGEGKLNQAPNKDKNRESTQQDIKNSTEEQNNEAPHILKPEEDYGCGTLTGPVS